MTAGQSCDRCAATLVRHERIPAPEHTYVTEKVEPSNGMIGYTRHKCTTCNFSYSDELVSSSYSEGLAYSVNPDGRTCTVTGVGTFTGSSLSVPDVIDGYRVTAIGKHAFAGNNNLNITMVIIPEGVKTIEKGAFRYADRISAISLPSSLEELGDEAFYGCRQLAMIVLPSGIKTIGKEVFAMCDSLESFTIPDGISAIPVGMFWSCDDLKTVVIPGSVREIGSTAFKNCGIRYLELPEGVEKIASEAFQYFKDPVNKAPRNTQNYRSERLFQF